MIIAIDGPAGAGKSTVAKELAKRLNFKYIDTGAMYRAITYELIERGLENEEDLEKIFEEILSSLDIDFVEGKIILNGKVLTTELRTPQIDRHVSEAASSNVVRSFLSKKQRQIALNSKDTILEGRDTTTVVCPDADIKVYLTASLEERARRRYEELLRRQIPVDLEEVKKQIERRDLSDIKRDVGPLKISEDANVIDSTDKDIDSVVNEILDLL